MTPARLIIALLVIVASAAMVLRNQRPAPAPVAVAEPVTPAADPALVFDPSAPVKPTALAVPESVDSILGHCTLVSIHNPTAKAIHVTPATVAVGATYFSDALCAKPLASRTTIAANASKNIYFVSRVLRDEPVRFATSENVLFEFRILTRKMRKMDFDGQGRSAQLSAKNGRTGSVDFRAAFSENSSRVEDRLIDAVAGLTSFRSTVNEAPLDMVATRLQVCEVGQAEVRCASRGEDGLLGAFAKMDLPSAKIYDIDGDSEQQMCAATDKGVYCWTAGAVPVKKGVDLSINVAVNDGGRVCGLTEAGKVSCEVDGTIYVLLKPAKGIFQGPSSPGSLAIEGTDGRVAIVSDSNSTDIPFCEISGANGAEEFFYGSKGSSSGSSPCRRGCYRRSNELMCWNDVANGVARPERIAEFL